MATAGMGDVLTGMIAGLLAQGLTAWDAARLGVYLHGLAGDIAASSIGEASLIASDLISAIPLALMKNSRNLNGGLRVLDHSPHRSFPNQASSFHLDSTLKRAYACIRGKTGTRHERW